MRPPKLVNDSNVGLNYYRILRCCFSHITHFPTARRKFRVWIQNDRGLTSKLIIPFEFWHIFHASWRYELAERHFVIIRLFLIIVDLSYDSYKQVVASLESCRNNDLELHIWLIMLMRIYLLCRFQSGWNKNKLTFICVHKESLAWFLFRHGTGANYCD